MRDRYLFSADRKASEYRTVLEITQGRARLLTPSSAARQLRWILSIALTVAYYALVSWLFLPVLITLSASGVATVAGWVVFIVAFAMFFGGLFVLFFWWDRRSLPLLADGPARATDLTLLGARSFGTFQEVRARTPWGEELHLVVDAGSPRFWEAMRLLEGEAVGSR